MNNNCTNCADKFSLFLLDFFSATIDLYHNPLAQENEYRLVVIFNIPSLKLLDRKGMFWSLWDFCDRLITLPVKAFSVFACSV